MPYSCNVLLIEDNFDDRIIINEMLSRDAQPYDDALYDLDCATTILEGRDALEKRCYDVVLLDLRLPDARRLEGFHLIRSACDDRPVIILTEIRDSKLALEAVGDGAQDYLVKSELNAALLTRSIRYAMQRRQHNQVKQVIIEKLTATVDDMWKLQKLVPICSRCMKIRDDKEYWDMVKDYIRKHPDGKLLRGVCPVCQKELHIS